MSDLGRIDEFRIAALRAAASRQDLPGHVAVLAEADRYLGWLVTPRAGISLGAVMVASQDAPALYVPIAKTGDPPMPVMTDGQNALFPAATAKDAKNFPVEAAVVLTDDDPGGVFATRTDNPDGSTLYHGNAPGVITLTWTSGPDSLVESLNITAGGAVSITVGDPVITDQ